MGQNSLRCGVRRPTEMKDKGDSLDGGAQQGREGTGRAGGKILYRDFLSLCLW